MVSPQLETQIAFEIAMAIGNSLELRTMARESLKTYLRKLNCPSGVILRGAGVLNDLHVVAESPRNATTHPVVKAAVEAIAERDNTEDMICGRINADYFYAMSLPGYGHIVLRRTSGELPGTVLASLEKLNTKLAGACIACEQNAELAEAKKTAEDADRAKTLFLANMSHEIRTPMNGVLGLAKLLLLSELPPREQQFVQTICSSAQSLLAVIDDVLHFSTLEHGKFTLQPEPTQLQKVLEAVVEILRPTASEKGLALNLSLAGSLPEGVLVDASRLRQVLTNLITNAIKFTEQGQIDVIARCSGMQDNRAAVEIQVIDTGIGISDEQAERLFDPFHQVHGTYDRSQGGVGLGLAITHELVGLMGGQIELRSRVDAGSCFTVSLELPTCQLPAAPLDDGKGAYANLSGLRILVAEDDATNRLVIGELLRLLGGSFMAVSDGAQAVEAVASGDFDLILMDVQMPHMDGLQATRRIRANGKALTREIPIIALTAHVMDEHRDQCIEAGMNAFLSKPISLDGLSSALSAFAPSGSGTPAQVQEIRPAKRQPSQLENESTCRFDPEELREMLGGDRALAERVLDTFRSEAPEVFQNLCSALESGDLDGAARLAHRLKGTTANMKAHAASAAFARLEQALRVGDRETVEVLSAGIPVYLDEILGARV